jgi:hypothetical protein
MRFHATSALIDQQQRGVMFLGKLNRLVLARAEQSERRVRLGGRPEDRNPFRQVRQPNADYRWCIRMGKLFKNGRGTYDAL